MVDAVIRLFESTATEFTTNGLGVLSDAISCEVVEERNGQFELSMVYPVDGVKYNEITLRRLIVARPNPFDNPQAFRIYSMTKPMNGKVSVAAEHISYDLSGYVVAPFESTTIGEAFSSIEAETTPSCPFTFLTDKTTSGDMKVTSPTSLRSLLGGMEGSILDIYGPGEYEFNNRVVNFWSARGQDKGVTIRYGKNMTDLEQEENCSAVYTAVYPYYYSEGDGLVTVPGKTVPVSGTFNFTRIKPLDLTSLFEVKPEPAALKTAAQKYLSEAKLGVPAVSLKVSFIQLAQAEEYKIIELLESVRLCDTVKVEFPKLGVTATSKCIKTIYNVIAGKYVSLELGDSKTNLATTIEKQNKDIAASIPESTPFKNAVSRATKLITGGLGGYVVLRSSSNSGKPDELLVMTDSEDPDTARKIWRFNKNGLGYSKDGYNGEYGLALTSDGQIVADRITTGTMSAARIRGGILNLGGNTNDGSYGNGVLRVYREDDFLSFQIDRTGIKHYSDVYNDFDDYMYIHNSLIEGYQRTKGSTGSYTKIGSLCLNAHITDGTDQSVSNGIYMWSNNYRVFIQSKRNNVYIEATNGLVSLYGKNKVWTGAYTVVGSGLESGSTDDNSRIEFMWVEPGSGTSQVYIPSMIAMHTYAGSNYYLDVYMSSDERLKKNIKPTKIKALEALSNVDYYEYDFINEPVHKDIGFVAQQLEKHIPTAVFDTPQNGDETPTKRINTSELVIYTAKAIKELNEKVKCLEELCKRSA